MVWIPPLLDQTSEYQEGYFVGSRGGPQTRWQTADWRRGWQNGRTYLYAEQDRGWRFDEERTCPACGDPMLVKDGEEDQVCSYNGCRYVVPDGRLDVDRHIRRLEGAERRLAKMGKQGFRRQT